MKMKNKKIIGLVLLTNLILMSSIPSVISIRPIFTSKKLDSDNSNHDPIIINGNDDFTPENGVTGGSGTENDPYIISDWIIKPDHR